jgi:hypothetical protein
MIVVADFYQLKDRNNEKFVVSGSKVIDRKGMKVEQSYVDSINTHSETSGKMFVIDQKATEQWKIDNEAKQESRKLKADKEKLGLTEQAEALLNRSNETKVVEMPKAPKEDAPKSGVTPEMIAEYKELFGKEPHHKLGAEKMLEEIANKKAEQ